MCLYFKSFLDLHVRTYMCTTLVAYMLADIVVAILAVDPAVEAVAVARV